MEALGGYASSGSSEEEEEMATAAAAAGVPQSNAAALAAEAARAERVAAMEKSDSDESEDSDESDSSDDSDDDEREAQEAGFRRGSSKAAAVSLPSASELMAGGGALCDTVGGLSLRCALTVFFLCIGAGDGGAGIYHNPYEQQEIHTKRKLGDNEDNTIFKKIQGKKKVYGQGPKPKTNSSVARSW